MANKEPWVFYVVLTNISDQPRTVWEDGNSWGYQVISFEMEDGKGEKTIIARRPGFFGKNTPRTFLVKPDEHRVYEIRLDGEWAARPALPKFNEMPVTVKVRYDVVPTPEAAQLNVWRGHLESKNYRLILRQW